jgi:hypothetical protein
MQGESEEGRNRTVQTLGNLTLLTKKLNSKVSNGPWTGEDGKRVALQGHSSLLLNARIESELGGDWDAQKISGRTTMMTRLVTKIWPVPVGHTVSPVGDNQVLGAYVSVEDLISAGMIDDGTVLRPASATFAQRSAMIRTDGSIELDSGEVFTSLSGAARHVRNSQTAPGWHFWRVESSGMLMYDIREEYRARFDLTLVEDEEELDALEVDEALV